MQELAAIVIPYKLHNPWIQSMADHCRYVKIDNCKVSANKKWKTQSSPSLTIYVYLHRMVLICRTFLSICLISISMKSFYTSSNPNFSLSYLTPFLRLSSQYYIHLAIIATLLWSVQLCYWMDEKGVLGQKLKSIVFNNSCFWTVKRIYPNLNVLYAE